MESNAWVTDLFQAIDRKDTAAFVSYLEPDGSFRFANNPASVGREAIGAAVDGFFGAIGGLSHRLDGVWQVGDVITVEGLVTYTRLDGGKVLVPFADIFHLGRGGRIQVYNIYMDLAPLWAPAS